MSSHDSAARPRKLTDFLCFAVYSANLAFGRVYKPILDKFGLTYLQYIAIVALHEEDKQTVSSLGEKLFLESNTLTPLLKKLEGMGFITRKRHPVDERQVVVSLTEAGRNVRKKISTVPVVKKSGLSAKEFASLQKAVVHLRDNLLKEDR